MIAMLALMRRRPIWRSLLPSLMEDFEDVFSTGLTPWTDSMMGVNLYEEGENLVVEVNLPGFKKDEIEVTVSSDSLKIKAEKKHEDERKDKNYYYREFSYSSAYRTIPLPKEIDTKKVNAKYENGILKLTARKKDAGTEGIKIKIE